jgi:DNA-binding CsgD family transcriptional regulator
MGGRVLDASPRALAFLAQFFPGEAAAAAKLPAALLAWFAHSRSWGLERPAIAHGEPFVVSRFGARLTVHYIPDRDDASAGFLLLRCRRVEVGADHLAGLPVTEREREVLALVAAGRTNGEIAAVLAISARTVQKHLEHIFQKLGVETRTAAAVCALAAADERVATGA